MVAPAKALPLPAAITYMACNGPQMIIRPFNRPMTKGLLCLRYSLPTNFITIAGVLNWKCLRVGNTFSICSPNRMRKIPAVMPTAPWVVGVKAMTDPNAPNSPPITV